MAAKSSSKQTPMMRQFYEIKEKHRDKILFFRMGDFYEMFGDDAVLAAKVLQIQLTTRNKNAENALPMCGIPYHAYEQYLNKLTLAGYKVAICEQMEDPSQAQGIVKRDVVRVVTPGTTVSPDLIDANKPSYLATVSFDKKLKKVGVAFADLTTGAFEVDELETDEGAQRLLEMFVLYQPKEVLLPEPKGEKQTRWANRLLEEVKNIKSTGHLRPGEFLDAYHFDFARCRSQLLDQFHTQSLEGFGIEKLDEAVKAAGALLQYLLDTQKDQLSHIQKIKRIARKNRMLLDEATVRNLELFESQGNGDESHTLIALLDKTDTPMGARLLRQWLGSPLLDAKEIKDRQDAVAELLNNTPLTDQLSGLFKALGDLERTIARIEMPVVSVLDFVRLRESLLVLPALKQTIQNVSSELLVDIMKEFDDLNDLGTFLKQSFLPEPSNKLREGGYIASGVSERLDSLRHLSKNAKQLMAELEAREKSSTGINNLKVKYNRVFGYYIEVSNAQKHLVPEGYIRKQTLVNGERYITEELKELEESILSAEDEASALEQDLFHEIREKTRKEGERVRKTSGLIAEIDSFCSMAVTARMNNYCRPDIKDIHDRKQFRLKASRHPVIEMMLNDEAFIPNDLDLETDRQWMKLITGPNMGGKSTYMRQIALAVLMAQTGSFIPAEEAVMPVFDRIFTRVGASDNLTRGQSTFMVEMNEAAAILNNATENSLVILDEIGRGTSTFDGISIAWAMVEHLHKVSSVTLFATHYHELTLLSDELKGVKNYHVAVQDEEEGIVFLRKILEGQSEKSYGIQVAKLAGLPVDVIDRAQEVLMRLEAAETKFAEEEMPDVVREKSLPFSDSAEQLSFFAGSNPIEDEIKAFDLINSTPMEAMMFLESLKKKVNL